MKAVLLAVICGLVWPAVSWGHGWNQLRWGMTTDEIRKLYPETVLLSEMEEQRGSGDVSYTVAKIPHFDVAGYDFEVRMMADKAGHLTGVSLHHPGKRDLQMIQLVLERLLTQKYGAPGMIKADPPSRYVTWFLENRRISLNHQAPGGGFDEVLNLFYLKPNPATWDKL